MLKLIKPNNSVAIKTNRLNKIEYNEESQPMYKVEKAKIKTDLGNEMTRWFITKEGLPEYQVNDFIFEKGLNKKTTARTYAYSLVKFLNFLSRRNISYLDCTQYYAKQYIKYLILGEMDDLKVIDSSKQVTYATLCIDMTVMTEFYKYLKDEQVDMQMDVRYVKKAKKKAFLYGQIFNFDYTKIIDRYALNLKGSKKYLKWYEDDEITAIRSNFNTLRDEVIFLLTLEGMRIDEVLSLKLDSIDDEEQTVQPTRSKGRREFRDGEENEIRVVAIPTPTYNLLNEYLMNERSKAEDQSGIYSDDLFINLKKNEHQGKPVEYQNYLKILKRAASRGGLKKSEIRTHSGRSTKVNELLEYQVLHPEDNITDEIIRQIIGWDSLDSIESYKNRGNKVIAKAAADKVQKRRKERNSPLSKTPEKKVKADNSKIISTAKKIHQKRGL